MILVRDGAGGPEFLLLRRAEKAGDQNSGRWVFPGGLVEEADRAAADCCHGLQDPPPRLRRALDDAGLDFLVAAVRECFEESGLLLAVDAHGDAVRPTPAQQARWATWRVGLHAGHVSLSALCEETGWRLAVDRLAYVSHWVTPNGLPKRFDTRFFVAAAPAGQVALHDAVEMTALRWVTAATALQGGEVEVLGPARALLREFAPFRDVASLLAWAGALEHVPCTRPYIARIGGGALGPVHPRHPAWAEIGLVDPQGTGRASDTIEPGRVVAFAPGRLRVSAANGSVMTGPGTNSYLLRAGASNDWAVIDPGPDDEAHVAALLAAAPGPIRWIFATHTHMDHSPAAARLKAATGALVHGRIADHPQGQDAAFAPDRLLRGGERIALGEDLVLDVIHTPGHASNHLCYRTQDRFLFTGDHVMQGSTVVINPPDGVMADYMSSLRALVDAADGPDGFDWIAPGHGFLIPRPREALEWLVGHRLKREARVVEVLSRRGPARVRALVAEVYDDVPAARHEIALRSLLAHLQYLQAQGRASESDGEWAMTSA